MVSPQAKRDAVRHTMQAHRLGVTRACGLVGISRSLFRYEPQRAGDAAVTTRLVALAVLIILGVVLYMAGTLVTTA